jgi:hypothetical protein
MQRALVGEWITTNAASRTIKVSYRVISGGSALLETFTTASGKETATVYHTDGDGLMLTHYCAQGNQARLRATEAAPQRIVFTLESATNVKPDQGVMNEMILTFKDGAFDQETLYKSPQGDDRTVLHFTRAPK